MWGTSMGKNGGLRGTVEVASLLGVHGPERRSPRVPGQQREGGHELLHEVVEWTEGSGVGKERARERACGGLGTPTHRGGRFRDSRAWTEREGARAGIGRNWAVEERLPEMLHALEASKWL